MVEMLVDPKITMCDLRLVIYIFLREGGDHAKDVCEVLQFLQLIDLVVDFVA